MFEKLQAMYQMLWDFIYKVLEILEIDLKDPYEAE